MLITLLKPKIFSLKNRTIQQLKTSFVNKDVLTAIFACFLIFSIYSTQNAFINKILESQSLQMEILASALSLTFAGFFMILIFYNTIISISSIYMSEEINLILSLPISKFQFFCAKLVEVLTTSSWFFSLLIIPTLFAYYHTLNLPMTFIFSSFLLLLLLLLIASSIGIIITTLFVNIIPPQRIKDVIIVVFFLVSCYLLSIDQEIRQKSLVENHSSFDQITEFLSGDKSLRPVWLPTTWMTNILSAYILKTNELLPLYWALSIISTIGLAALSFLIFDIFFTRGLNIAKQGVKLPKIYFSELFSLIGRIIIPLNSQLRAIAFKEAKIFFRDTTQALQFLLLLILTFIYLYNFKILNTSTQISGADAIWWKIILTLANIGFGNFVMVAIATRFVYPSISLEGRSFTLLCSTPLTIEKILTYKFFAWLFPVIFLNCLLLDSGIMAIQGSTENLLWTTIISVALSIGIVGLGIGVGAVYAKFDWESPAQIHASFGSLVYMFISICVIGLSCIPATLLVIIGSLTEFTSKMGTSQYYLSIIFSLSLLFFINITTARKAIVAGANSLREKNLF